MKIINKNILWFSILWGMFLGIAVSIVYYSFVREFNIDEFEHIHTSWKILQGYEIYVDFFQHHHPLLNYLITPILYIFGDTTTAIFVSRYLILLILAGILAATYFISLRLFKDSEIGIISLILTSTVVTFFVKSIEVRPEVPQTLMGLLSIYFLFVYYDKKSLESLLASAVFLAISFLFLQKAVVLCLVLGVLFLYDLCRKEMQFRHVLLYITTFVLCISPYYIYHIINGSIKQYFVMNWLVNINYPKHFATWIYMIVTIQENILTCTLFLLGILALMRTKRRTNNQIRFGILSIGLILSLFLFKNTWRHYFIMLIPTVGIISSYALHSIFKDKLSKLIVLLGAIYIPMAIIHDHGLFKRKNIEQLSQLNKIEYVLSITKQDDKAYDGNMKFNLFRDDIDYFWYCVGKNHCLDSYKTITDYDYDIYELISTNKPRVISTFGIDNLDDKRIKDYYKTSERYQDLLIRVK